MTMRVGHGFQLKYLTALLYRVACFNGAILSNSNTLLTTK